MSNLSEKLENARAGGDCVTTCDVTEAMALEERLAQAERERQEQCERADRQGIRAQKVERERDALKAELLQHYQRASRMENARDAALAKAEAAEKASKEAWAAAHHNAGLHLAEANEHARLCARIEALADEWEGVDWGPGSEQLRALLQPQVECCEACGKPK